MQRHAIAVPHGPDRNAPLVGQAAQHVGRVVHQVRDHLAQRAAVAVDEGQLGRDVVFERDAVAREPPPLRDDRLVHHLGDVDGAERAASLAREEQQVLHHHPRTLGLLGQRADVVARDVGQRLDLQTLGQQPDRGERVVELVRDPCDDPAQCGELLRLDQPLGRGTFGLVELRVADRDGRLITDRPQQRRVPPHLLRQLIEGNAQHAVQLGIHAQRDQDQVPCFDLCLDVLGDQR